MKSIMEPINRSTHNPSLHGDDARKRRDPEDQINDYQAATRRSDYREGDSDSEYPTWEKNESIRVEDDLEDLDDDLEDDEIDLDEEDLEDDVSYI